MRELVVQRLSLVPFTLVLTCSAPPPPAQNFTLERFLKFPLDKPKRFGSIQRMATKQNTKDATRDAGYMKLETAIEALRDLQQHIEDVITDQYERCKDDPECNVEGWKPADDYRDWLKANDDRDGFLNRLIGLGLCVSPAKK